MKTHSGRKASQRPDEIYPFIDLLVEEGVTSYLEVGARHGDTFYEVVTRLPKGSKAVAVDLPGGQWGHRSSRDALKKCVADLCKLGYDASVVFGDSRAAGTIQLVQGRGPYDAALIDGDHRYDGVKADWETYGPMADLIAFHDVAGEGVRQKTTGAAVEVPRLWREIRDDYQHVEFIGPDSLMGIGALWR